MTLAAITLDDKYERDAGTIYLTGTQALVKLAMLQQARDHAGGLDTACFISGYRGSPMHNADKELWRASRFLPRSNIHFVPAVNEDLAVTSLWGAQQATLYPDAKHDGVFGMWYGKGPGLDRSVDAMRHANMAGTAPHGGVLAIVGDDHAMASTDVTAVSEPTFADLMMPVLYPASVQELIAFGLLGFALSRFCGAWVGFKTVSDTLDTVATVDLSALPSRIDHPPFEFPSDGVHIRVPDPWINQERRLRRFKIPAALAFARANELNRSILTSARPRFGIVSSGVAALGVLDALASLGLDRTACADLGIVMLKIAMPHPLDLDALRAFGDGLEEVLVVEEKRALLEQGLKEALYELPDRRRPRVTGRFDEHGKRLISELGELTSDAIERVIAARIEPFHTSDRIRERLAFLAAKDAERSARTQLSIVRTPFFCSGCPHNSSTRVPEGSRAHGGVGCHFMATNMERDNVTHTHMGGEGATWIGQSPFVATEHVFQNIGDGTYYHSGILAIRACVAAGVNITYKILYNDAVAMTGGQPVDGPLDPAIVTQQVFAEGVRKIVIVTDDPDRYRGQYGRLARGTRVEHRGRLDRVQRELREWKGVSVLLYDQTCAAEKRRRRKRGTMVDPPERVFINDRVCEGCGDCSERSNCLSVVPVDTEFGRKRRIDQSSCNKDFSCREGFCPSFVTVVGGEVRKSAAAVQVPPGLALLPEPERPEIAQDGSYGILVTGIGGTGVVTVGAMITMAAHLEGKACAAIDQFGMAQKGGAVTSHIRVARHADSIRSAHLGAGAADLVLGCDGLVAAGDLALATMAHGRTRAIVNTHQTITGQFTRDQDLEFPVHSIAERIEGAVGKDGVEWLDATRVATRLMGDAIATNLFVLGYAYQEGLIPVTSEGIERAIELNGIAVESNVDTFRWGRRAALDPAAVNALLGADGTAALGESPPTLAALTDRFAGELVDYQDRAYAARYRQMAERAATAEAALGGPTGFASAVARYGYKLMAYKDEYEVARLYSRPAFREALEQAFSGDFRLRFHLAPPLLTRTDPDTGLPRKQTYGPWMLRAMGVLARLRRMRGTPLDPFGRSAERRVERQLVDDYERMIGEICENLRPENHELATELASLPERIRGYGHVKQRHLDEVMRERVRLLTRWRRTAAGSSDGGAELSAA